VRAVPIQSVEELKLEPFLGRVRIPEPPLDAFDGFRLGDEFREGTLKVSVIDSCRVHVMAPFLALTVSIAPAARPSPPLKFRRSLLTSAQEKAPTRWGRNLARAVVGVAPDTSILTDWGRKSSKSPPSRRPGSLPPDHHRPCVLGRQLVPRAAAIWFRGRRQPLKLVLQVGDVGRQEVGLVVGGLGHACCHLGARSRDDGAVGLKTGIAGSTRQRLGLRPAWGKTRRIRRQTSSNLPIFTDERPPKPDEPAA